MENEWTKTTEKNWENIIVGRMFIYSCAYYIGCLKKEVRYQGEFKTPNSNKKKNLMQLFRKSLA